MNERLVAARAADGLLLSGVEIRPGPRPHAVVVWIHGFGVTYDLPPTVRVGRLLAAAGVGFVAGNLRGHDGGATGWRLRPGGTELVRVGSWWEVFEESAQDVGAWVDHARGLGAPRIVLAGHSFGALRAVYYLSEVGDAGVDGVVLASASFGLRRLDAGIAREAEALVDAGRGEELLPAGSWPGGFGTTTVSAQTYASWWRVAPGFFTHAPNRFGAIRSPVLAYFGDRGDVGGRADLEWIAAQATGSPSVTSRLLPGVTHGYEGGEEAVAGAIAGWIRDCGTSGRRARRRGEDEKEEVNAGQQRGG